MSYRSILSNGIREKQRDCSLFHWNRFRIPFKIYGLLQPMYDAWNLCRSNRNECKKWIFFVECHCNTLACHNLYSGEQCKHNCSMNRFGFWLVSMMILSNFSRSISINMCIKKHLILSQFISLNIYTSTQWHTNITMRVMNSKMMDDCRYVNLCI